NLRLPSSPDVNVTRNATAHSGCTTGNCAAKMVSNAPRTLSLLLPSCVAASQRTAILMFMGKLRHGLLELARISFRQFPLDIHRISMYCASMIRKELVAASAEPLILSLLSKGESYGYAIIQEVKTRSGGKMNWTDGMLYPVLHRMERRGLIKSRWGESETGRKRKYYSLKKDGKTAMGKHHEQWSLVHSVLAGLKKEQYV